MKTLNAAYIKYYLRHDSIGPSCSMAVFENDDVTVRPTPKAFIRARRVVEMLSMPKEGVRCIHTEGSGRYGHNGADDVATHAALTAVALPAQPVRVQLMREQENTWGHFTPAMATEVSASLDAQGNIVNWNYENAVRHTRQMVFRRMEGCKDTRMRFLRARPGSAWLTGVQLMGLRSSCAVLEPRG